MCAYVYTCVREKTVESNACVQCSSIDGAKVDASGLMLALDQHNNDKYWFYTRASTIAGRHQLLLSRQTRTHTHTHICTCSYEWVVDIGVSWESASLWHMARMLDCWVRWRQAGKPAGCSWFWPASACLDFST